jgi:hypothetical protein
MGVARWACLRCQGNYEPVVDGSGQDNIIQCGECVHDTDDSTAKVHAVLHLAPSAARVFFHTNRTQAVRT